MLSNKIIGAAVVGLGLMFTSSADAHPRHVHVKPKPVHVVKVTLGWSWVNATLFHRGYWVHPQYGKSHRSIHVGPPPQRPRAHAVWVHGKWVGKGPHRSWVPGHWR